MQRISLRDIALEAGVHVSTVSLALRNHRKIPEATRVRIAAVAERLGYRPDPMLGALCAYRRTRRDARFEGTLAWIDSHATPDLQWYGGYFAGAEAAARRLGFNVERFWLRAPGMSPARVSAILRARGIHGVLVAPQPIAHAHLRMTWEDFSAVRIGYSLWWPPLHLVTSHQFRNAVECVRGARKLGFQRVSLVLSSYSDERAERSFSGGFAAAQSTLPSAHRLPPLIYRGAGGRAQAPVLTLQSTAGREVLAWVKKHRPDAIITLSTQLPSLLEKAGLQIPVISLALDETESGNRQPGIVEHRAEIGAAGVELVADMIRRGERGIPAVPRMVLVPGAWFEPPDFARPATPQRERRSRSKLAGT